MNAFDRNTNLQIIHELRNSEKIALDDYIDKVLIPLQKENPNFCNILYKDIIYILDGIDDESENDILIENGDFVIEDGDIKLTGYQTRLHDITIWLHTELSKEIFSKSKHPNEFIDKMDNHEKTFLRKENYTPEYKNELDKIKRSLEKEKKENYGNRKQGLSRFFDSDILELKPNFYGIGINLNELIKKIRRK